MIYLNHRNGQSLFFAFLLSFNGRFALLCFFFYSIYSILSHFLYFLGVKFFEDDQMQNRRC
ncbi:uncharacterized protein BO88DRAFT_119988 [Aspergillus vadensis CBS 113365]|uniref:Uncharacterized protein n=1 Tax=Aspergillus vadensis (strain CBS 113365 / IMI 142717 / IBT 24658) TaxID=1448311 RepID=A0A319B3U4_ASPVC|nr:hypothetical protein BO88DRAFT_119988 [Aspergillus vadensis CBS 113365]PYH66481.1 hypothetical protein BO88DRAFT_119988 [Aspergillus vadensis CBS 113365]